MCRLVTKVAFDREFSRRKPLPLGMGIGATYKKEI